MPSGSKSKFTKKQPLIEVNHVVIDPGPLSDQEFNAKSIEIFRYQVNSNPVYGEFVGTLGTKVDAVERYDQIPFLPIELFKSHRVLCGEEYEQVFSSSGTTGSVPSLHYVKDLSIYKDSFVRAFEEQIGSPEDFCFLCLLPSYLERTGSSLIYMADAFIQMSKHESSGFYLDEMDQLERTIQALGKAQIPTVLLGVSFALLDFAERYQVSHPNLIVMETGGMKGRREEMTRAELHEALRPAFGVDQIHSEYGMTELLSQAYSKGGGLFETPPWMKVLIRDVNDPGSYLESGRTGAMNIIDLANAHSCSFIATQDLGRITTGGFEVLGRMDNTDLRGCNLLVME